MEYKKDEHLTKYDYNLWYGYRNSYGRFRGTLVQSLIRSRKVEDRKDCNCVNNRTGELLSHEILAFGSRKAAARYVRRHYPEIIEAYAKRNPRNPDEMTTVAAFGHLFHTRRDVIINVKKLMRKDNG